MMMMYRAVYSSARVFHEIHHSLSLPVRLVFHLRHGRRRRGPRVHGEGGGEAQALLQLCLRSVRFVRLRS